MPARGDDDVRRWETCGQAWIGALRHVWAAGEAGLEDGGPIIEGPPMLFEIGSLSWEDPILHEYGDRARLVRRAQERTRRVVRGRYWPRLHELDGHDQIRWVVELLRARPWTTSAWISLTIPGEPADGLPALTALSFRIRGYRLGMTAMFRSQNVHRAYLMYIPLREVQAGVAGELGLPAGPLRVFVDVPHIHVGDAERVAAVLAAVPEPNAA
ncbi:thymidylate synthase [Mycobacterium tuberculosis]|nr:thymidylate synthase [Mycobacterium tuberculosis]